MHWIERISLRIPFWDYSAKYVERQRQSVSSKMFTVWKCSSNANGDLLEFALIEIFFLIRMNIA